MSKVGKSEIRVDAFDKVTGRTKYYEDRMPAGALYARIKHSTIAHGFVKSVDKSAAEAIPGVVKVLTCFDVPEHCFPTAGHPWSMDPGHQDVADRNLLNRHVRYYGDDVAVVIAEDEVSAMQGVRALKVEYEELPFVLDVQKAMEPDAPCIHENFPGNILKHTDIRKGNYQQAIKEPGLIKVEGWYNTPTVQHSHIENHGCYAYEENGRIVVVSSTQIPHIIRRIVGQALGRPWADIRVIKPYIGGGFGNKQDALYEPLCAWCSTQVHGKCVRIDCSREETFVSNRVRHSIRFHIITWLHKDGLPRARSSASPIRARMPRTVIRSSPRPWARSRRSIPATISRATLTPCTQTAPPRARCAATACRRRRSRTTRTSTSARRPLAWSRSNTA